MFFLFKNKEGGLLLELMVVFGILSLLTAISIPYIRQYQPNLKLNATARDLVADLRYAQQLTITEQVVYAVDFNLEGDSYEIIKTGSATTTVKTVDFDDEINYEQITGLTDNQSFFNFYGGVNEAGQIVLRNINGLLSVINIKPSGYIQLEN